MSGIEPTSQAGYGSRSMCGGSCRNIGANGKALLAPPDVPPVICRTSGAVPGLRDLRDITVGQRHGDSVGGPAAAGVRGGACALVFENGGGVFWGGRAGSNPSPHALQFRRLPNRLTA